MREKETNITYYKKNISNNILDDIYKKEEAKLDRFKKEFQSTYSELLLKYDLHSEIHLERWKDSNYTRKKRKLDGYTAMIQVDLLDRDNTIVEVDEDVCSVTGYITYISFSPVNDKYGVYETDELNELWNDTRQMIQWLETHSSYLNRLVYEPNSYSGKPAFRKFIYDESKEAVIVNHEEQMQETYVEALNRYSSWFVPYGCTLKVGLSWIDLESKRISDSRLPFRKGYACYAYCEVWKDGKEIYVKNMDGDVDYCSLSTVRAVSGIERRFFKTRVSLYSNTDTIENDIKKLLQALCCHK